MAKTLNEGRIAQDSITRPTRHRPLRPTRPTRPTNPGENTKTQDETQRKKDINTGLASIEYNPENLVNGTLYNDTTIYPEAFESMPDRDFAYILSRKEEDISLKEIYVRGSGYENIYPGAILYVDEDITGGSPNPLARIQRNKITLFGDFLSGSNPEVRDINPSNADVRNAKNQIMNSLLNDPKYDAPGMQRIRTKIHTSQKSLMMDLGVDASFAGCSMKINASTSSSEQSFIQATTMDQDYFTVKMKDEWKNDPSILFGENVTWEELKKELNGRAIAIVTSVTYGRTFSYLKEYSGKKYKSDTSGKVSGWGQSAYTDVSTSFSSDYISDEIFNIGGTALPKETLRSTKTQSELEQVMANNMKFSSNNQGVVTKYTIQLITGKNTGKVIKPLYSGKQYHISYTRCPRRINAKINVKDVRILDGKVKVQMDVQCFRVVNGKVEIFKSVDGNSSKKAQDPWWYTFSGSRNREYGDLKAGEYIYKDPKVRIRTKNSRVDGYDAQDERRLDKGEIETGSIEIVLNGSVFSSVKIREIKSL